MLALTRTRGGGRSRVREGHPNPSRRPRPDMPRPITAGQQSEVSGLDAQDRSAGRWRSRTRTCPNRSAWWRTRRTTPRPTGTSSRRAPLRGRAPAGGGGRDPARGDPHRQTWAGRSPPGSNGRAGGRGGSVRMLVLRRNGNRSDIVYEITLGLGGLAITRRARVGVAHRGIGVGQAGREGEAHSRDHAGNLLTARPPCYRRAQSKPSDGGKVPPGVA